MSWQYTRVPTKLLFVREGAQAMGTQEFLGLILINCLDKCFFFFPFCSEPKRARD